MSIKNKVYSDTTAYKLYSKEINKYVMMNSKREKQIKSLYNNPNTSDVEKERLKQEMIEGHLKYVLQQANKYSGMGIELDDLIAEGNMGLIKAMSSFDWNRDIKFITHASYHVRGEILFALNNNARSIRLPMNVMHQLNTEMKNLREKGIEMSDELINLPTTTDLHRTVGEDSILADVLKNNNAKIADYDYEFDDLVDYLLSRLDDRSAKIVSLLFGLKGEQKDMKDIAVDMGLNVETIRLIKNKALEKLDKRISLTF
jgi:RNA polymerase sigma factor (sigma-70 family)